MTAITSIETEDLTGFNALAGGRPQLLVFGASWCAPCKAMVPTVDDIADIHGDAIAVARIDIERSPGLAAMFGVRAVPTLVIRRGDEELSRHTGTLTRTRLSMLLDDVAR